VSPAALELWAGVQMARDIEARTALAWAEAVGPGPDEAERFAYEAFEQAVDEKRLLFAAETMVVTGRRAFRPAARSTDANRTSCRTK
jgi:hypothetical protein